MRLGAIELSGDALFAITVYRMARITGNIPQGWEAAVSYIDQEVRSCEGIRLAKNIVDSLKTGGGQ